MFSSTSKNASAYYISTSQNRLQKLLPTFPCRASSTYFRVVTRVLQKTLFKHLFGYLMQVQHVAASTVGLASGLPDFSWNNKPKREKIYQVTLKYIHQNANKIPNGCKMDQMAIKYANIFH
jgi:hypothetical protein